MRSEETGTGVLEHWSPDEVASALARGEAVLVDVRTPQEYMVEHIEAALLKPLAFFDPAHLPEDPGAGQGQGSGSGKRVILHCGSGVRSARAAALCLGAGAGRAAHLEGGFAAWKAAGLPYVGTDMGSGAPKRMGLPTE